MKLLFLFGLFALALFTYAMFAWDGFNLVNATRCHFEQGEYRKVSNNSDERECVKGYVDANAACTSSSECQGGCMVNSQYDWTGGYCKPTTQTKGICMYPIEDVRSGKARTCSQ